MKIETKFNINQEVWFLEDDKVKNEAILKIAFTKDDSNESVFYYFKERSMTTHNWERIREESKVFATKEELINSL